MPRSCLLELAAALCALPRGTTQAITELLALGEVGTGVSRAITVPLLATLLTGGSAEVPPGTGLA